MQPLTDINYKTIIENHFKNSKIVFCAIVSSLKCSNCITVKSNISYFNKKHPYNNIEFYYIEYTKYDMLQHYYQLTRLMEYPKIIVYYGDWENIEFYEGVITIEELEDIHFKK